ncbi:MAG: histone deacetylase, partial [Candidatus Bipolaricaulia bacterium]
MRRAFTSDRHEVPLPDGHRFPMRKYRRLRDALVERGILRAHQIRDAAPASWADLHLVHDREYVRRLRQGTLGRRAERRLGFPWSEALVQRARASVGATLNAARAALDDGLSGNLAGGTHHAHVDWGSGYCLFNDVAIALRVLQRDRRVERALVVDLDVHQGDGTAAIFAGDPSVHTFSMHGATNFPFRKAASDLDVPLPEGIDDAAFLEALQRHLPQAFEAADPEFVVYLAGADVLASDRLGTFDLTLAGIRRRDEYVLRACLQRGLPTTLVMGGGYGEPLSETIEAQCRT